MINEAIAALGTKLSGISGLRVYDHAAETVHPPAAMVYLGQGTYDEDFGDAVQFDATIILLVTQGAGLDQAQDAFQSYLDPSGAKSIAAAIHADATLGSVVNTCRVVGWDDPKTFNIGGVDFAGVEISVEILTA